MSGTLPTSPMFSSYRLRSIQPAYVDQSQSNRRHSRKTSAHIWRIDVTYPELYGSELWPLYAFLLAQEGESETFQMQLPDKNTPSGAWSGTPLVSGGSQCGNTLDIDGASVSVTDWGKAGDIFTVAGDSKVYMLTEDCNSDGGGAVTLTFIPELQTTPADNAAITSSNVQFTVALTNPENMYDIQPGELYSINVGFVEHLP